eukprot:Awhi_evm2s1311
MIRLCFEAGIANSEYEVNITHKTRQYTLMEHENCLKSFCPEMQCLDKRACVTCIEKARDEIRQLARSNLLNEFLKNKEVRSFVDTKLYQNKSLRAIGISPEKKDPIPQQMCPSLQQSPSSLLVDEKSEDPIISSFANSPSESPSPAGSQNQK